MTEKTFCNIVWNGTAKGVGVTVEQLKKEGISFDEDVIHEGDELLMLLDFVPLNKVQHAAVTYTYSEEAGKLTITTGFAIDEDCKDIEEHIDLFEHTADGDVLLRAEPPFPIEEDELGEYVYFKSVSNLMGKSTEKMVEEVMRIVKLYRGGEGFNKYIVPCLEPELD